MLPLLSAVVVCHPSDDLTKYVNILGGTKSHYDLGRGSLLPFIGRPWSMNNWAIQTNDYAGSRVGPLSHWWFHPEDAWFYGFRCTHQASPWIYDYGELLLTPSIGPLSDGWPTKAASYSRQASTFSPDEINVTLQSYCTAHGCLQAAITATERAAMLRLTFPPLDNTTGWNQTRHLRLLIGRDGAALTDHAEANATAGTLTGFTRANSGGVPIEEAALPDEQLASLRAAAVRATVGGAEFFLSSSRSLVDGLHQFSFCAVFSAATCRVYSR